MAHWRIAPDLIVRLQKTDGKASEWVIYTVSSDGKVFTSVSWVPSTPNFKMYRSSRGQIEIRKNILMRVRPTGLRLLALSLAASAVFTGVAQAPKSSLTGTANGAVGAALEGVMVSARAGRQQHHDVGAHRWTR